MSTGFLESSRLLVDKYRVTFLVWMKSTASLRFKREEKNKKGRREEKRGKGKRRGEERREEIQVNLCV